MSSDTINRKLTTILEADVVGFSRLMAVDEEATFGMLQTYRGFIDSQIVKHGGRVFNTAGDAVLAEFGSAVEAVRCAISIQEDLRVRNSELPEERQMWFRIGINVGDVMIEKGDLFGEGVNVAARLESLAEKGGICISGSTFDLVKNKLSIAFKNIGPQNVKNIPYPVPAFQLVPGQVSIKVEDTAAGPRGWKAFATGNRLWLAIAGAGAVAVLVVGAYFGNLLPFGSTAKQPFDGSWKATLSSLSGCLNNNSRSFPISIRQSKINEPQELFPKKGVVSADGKFRIAVSTKQGEPRGTLVGTIDGDRGIGRLLGRRPSCTGTVTLVRLK
jgi:class 3 adenylate cyclase